MAGKPLRGTRLAGVYQEGPFVRLEGNPCKDQILYSICKNNPRMDDESGLSKHSCPEKQLFSLYGSVSLSGGDPPSIRSSGRRSSRFFLENK